MVIRFEQFLIELLSAFLIFGMLTTSSVATVMSGVPSMTGKSVISSIMEPPETPGILEVIFRPPERNWGALLLAITSDKDPDVEDSRNPPLRL